MLCANYFCPTLRARRREHEEFFSRKISVTDEPESNPDAKFKIKYWPYRLTVRTSAFQAGKRVKFGKGTQTARPERDGARPALKKIQQDFTERANPTPTAS